MTRDSQPFALYPQFLGMSLSKGERRCVPVRSFNGRTAVLQTADGGSIPSRTTWRNRLIPPGGEIFTLPSGATGSMAGFEPADARSTRASGIWLPYLKGQRASLVRRKLRVRHPPAALVGPCSSREERPTPKGKAGCSNHPKDIKIFTRVHDPARQKPNRASGGIVHREHRLTQIIISQGWPHLSVQFSVICG